MELALDDDDDDVFDELDDFLDVIGSLVSDILAESKENLDKLALGKWNIVFETCYHNQDEKLKEVHNLSNTINAAFWQNYESTRYLPNLSVSNVWIVLSVLESR